MELSELCGTSLNLLVKDKKYDKITQYHSNDESMILENIFEQFSEDAEHSQSEVLRINSVNTIAKFGMRLASNDHEAITC